MISCVGRPRIVPIARNLAGTEPRCACLEAVLDKVPWPKCSRPELDCRRLSACMDQTRPPGAIQA
jgi:hypothetical protein